jgi:hypothetical protein
LEGFARALADFDWNWHDIADCEIRIADLCFVPRLKLLLQIQSAIRNPKSEIALLY